MLSFYSGLAKQWITGKPDLGHNGYVEKVYVRGVTHLTLPGCAQQGLVEIEMSTKPKGQQGIASTVILKTMPAITVGQAIKKFWQRKAPNATTELLGVGI